MLLSVGRLILGVAQPRYQGDTRRGPPGGAYCMMYLYISAEGEAARKMLQLDDREEHVEVALLAGSVYTLTAAAWAPGVEAQFWISVSAAGAVLTPDRGAAAPSTGEAAAMAPRAATPVACCVCDKPLSGGRFDVDDGLVHADGARLGRGNAPSGAFLQKRVTHCVIHYLSQ